MVSLIQAFFIWLPTFAESEVNMLKLSEVVAESQGHGWSFPAAAQAVVDHAPEIFKDKLLELAAVKLFSQVASTHAKPAA